MQRDELRAAQRPLRERYQSEPAAATITLAAAGDLDDSQIACRVETGRELAKAGLHPATGGDGSAICSGDMLLQALVACAGVTLRAVAVNRGLDVTGTVRAEGDLDVRGTLGTDRSVPVGFGEIRLSFELASDAPQDALDDLIITTERCCVVLQTLVGSPRVVSSRAAVPA